jgi:hypothetical protein
LVAAVAVPLALLPGASQAAPTITIAQAEQQLSALQAKQDAAAEAYDAGQIALTAAQRSASTAQVSVTHQQTKVAAAQAQLAGLARMAYMTGGIDPVTGLLDGQGAADVVERVGNLDHRTTSAADSAVGAAEGEPRPAR